MTVCDTLRQRTSTTRKELKKLQGSLVKMALKGTTIGVVLIIMCVLTTIECGKCGEEKANCSRNNCCCGFTCTAKKVCAKCGGATCPKCHGDASVEGESADSIVRLLLRKSEKW